MGKPGGGRNRRNMIRGWQRTILSNLSAPSIETLFSAQDWAEIRAGGKGQLVNLRSHWTEQYTNFVHNARSNLKLTVAQVTEPG